MARGLAQELEDKARALADAQRLLAKRNEQVRPRGGGTTRVAEAARQTGAMAHCGAVLSLRRGSILGSIVANNPARQRRHVCSAWGTDSGGGGGGDAGHGPRGRTGRRALVGCCPAPHAHRAVPCLKGSEYAGACGALAARSAWRGAGGGGPATGCVRG